MDKAKAIPDGRKLPPLRSLNDFILESSRFQLPNFKDFEKWGNRVVNNLIYYQTNYLYMSIAIILIVGSMHPSKILFGVSTVVLMWTQYLYGTIENKEVANIRRQYPLLQLVMLFLCAYYVFVNLNSIFLVLFSFLLSFCIIFIHASLRLRHLKNKIVNKIEGIGLERTPMGIFLQYFEDVTGIVVRAQTTFVQSLQ
ncbi:PREDICTED: PRA1 family protein 3-like isoform X2 [Dufourea novaeangliae]|uniref:PRA1 family protein 3-like isoform X2 n=1 Tax=Dufourea novaeangliae TaxID=178035 RepID=UPI000766E1D0|nr:PREDICTED: PRA1 family protein 3-like isoform X2 [Dufourea novaeangliae]